MSNLNKVKRTTIRGSLTRFIKHFNAVKDFENILIEDLQHRLNKAEELLEQFNNAQLEIETEDPDFETNYPNDHSNERQESLQICDDNYEVAWKLLMDRFENKQAMIKNHVKAFFEIPMLK
ncbi:hypothetical protein JTB14_031410 [Gonioctena quinquepunctata]|nr:hypothetical protein JTB14_031410 [Gonioctena quinquepunctata]